MIAFADRLGDVVPHHGAVNVISASLQLQLRHRQRLHDPERLHMREVVEHQARNRQRAQVLQARRSGQILKLARIRKERQRNNRLEIPSRQPARTRHRQSLVRVVGSRASQHHRTVRVLLNALRISPRTERVVLLQSQEFHVMQPFAALFNVPVQHGRIRIDPQFMRRAMHIKPLVAADLALEGLIVHAIIKDLRAAARQAAKARCDQITQHSKHALVPIAAALGDALQMHNLYRSERLDVNLWRFFTDGAQHVGVVTERKPRMQSANNVHLRGAALACLARFCADVIQVVFVRAVLILLAMERAELATEGTDVRVIQMPIDVVEDRVAMQASAHHVGQAADFMDVRGSKEHCAIRRGEPFAHLHFACDVHECRVAAAGSEGRVTLNRRCSVGARNRCGKRHKR